MKVFIVTGDYGEDAQVRAVFTRKEDAEECVKQISKSCEGAGNLYLIQEFELDEERQA